MFNEFPDMKVVERLRRLYPAGTRVILEKMEDPYTKLKPGDGGTVLYVDDAAGIHINWDNGSSLAAIYGVDEIRKLQEAAHIFDCMTSALVENNINFIYCMNGH